MEIASGTMVSAHIRLTAPIGEGAMGAVWAADHLTLGTQVAVKFIAPELGNEHPDVLERFKREASLTARIRSPHVVQTFDQGVMEDGTPYIVMELLEGETLQDLLERHGPLPLPLATQIFVQVARALARAHDAGIIHRDIKPENVFVTPSDEGVFCKVLDFGIAKQTELPKMGGLTSPGVMIGTPEYMSPEQVLSAKDVDARADMWALSVTLYHVLTGRLPFVAEALGALCIKLLDAKFTPPSRHRPDVPAGTDTWFGRALARKPEDRYASIREMARAWVKIATEQDDEIEDDVSTSRILAAFTAAHADELAAFREEHLGAAPTLSGSAHNRRLPGAEGKPRWAWLGAAAAVAIVAAAATAVAVGGDDAAERTELPDPGQAAAATAAFEAEAQGGAAEPSARPTDPAATSSATTGASADPETAADASASADSKAVAPPPRWRAPSPAKNDGYQPKIKRRDHGI